MRPDLKRYDVFGWDYEHFNPLTDEEKKWYKNFARRTGGSVLELGCGTGRLLVSIARDGYETVGLDLSANMLRLAKEQISHLPRAVQKRIHLCKGDISDFSLRRRFSMIILADGSFRELKTREQQLSCLKCVHDHLTSDGKFLVTVRRFDPTKFMNGVRVTAWSKSIRHPITGHLVMRKLEARLTADMKWVHEIMFYRTISPDGTEAIEECPFKAPVMLTEDYISLFADTGFSTSVYAGYEEREDDGSSPLLCFVCAKHPHQSPLATRGKPTDGLGGTPDATES